jgi:hypothetical protein
VFVAVTKRVEDWWVATTHNRIVGGDGILEK